MARNKVLILLILLAGVTLGGFREFLFLNLHYQIDHVARHTHISYAHSLFQGWVSGVGLRGLVFLKWGLTVLFILLMWMAGVSLSRVIHGDQRYTRMISGLFACVVLLAAVLHVLARWAGGLESVSVKLLHALQFPVLLFFIWAASLLKAGKARG